MCGIFGSVNYKIPRETEVFNGLLHRGPDQQQHRRVNNVTLFHTRLAIQDLSVAGQQPMEHENMIIVFNGEIYNHMELRAKYGLKAQSNSDTLTLLMLFKLLGMAMLEELDGMFAFALYDISNRRLFIARDRSGKKPLYLYSKNDTFVFSSELKILAQVTKPEIDYEALSDYLYLGHHYRKATPYKEVREVENGHYLTIDTLTGTVEDTAWFKIEKFYKTSSSLSYEDSLLHLEELLKKAVSRRLDSSDLDVGSFLSGGIDSGVVTALAAEHSSKLKTFTVKIDGSFDESELAAQVAKKYDTDHHVVEIDFSHLQNDIEKIITNHGEPNSDNSAIPSYYVAKAAKEHITVVLNGDGADELFGGYRRYVPFSHVDFFNPSALTKFSSSILTKVLPVANKKHSNYTYLYRLLKFASYSDLVKIYCSASSDLMVGYEDQFIQQPQMTAIREDLTRINEYPISSLKKILLMDFESMLFSRLLPKMDIATMAHSLEGRSPFLSKEILEFAPTMEDSFKIKKIQTKHILRDLGKKLLPSDLISQPKRGFEIPLSKWVDNELKEIIHTYLFAHDTLYSKLIKKEFVHDLVQRKILISDEKRAKIIFSIFSMEVWYKNL